MTTKIEFSEAEIKDACAYHARAFTVGFPTAADVVLRVHEATQDGPHYTPGYIEAIVTVRDLKKQESEATNG